MTHKVDVKKVVKVWCRLDNMFGWLEHLKTVYDVPQTKNHIIYEQEKVDIMRHELMQACGFEDYDEFVKFIQENDYATWDKFVEKWTI